MAVPSAAAFTRLLKGCVPSSSSSSITRARIQRRMTKLRGGPIRRIKQRRSSEMAPVFPGHHLTSRTYVRYIWTRGGAPGTCEPLWRSGTRRTAAELSHRDLVAEIGRLTCDDVRLQRELLSFVAEFDRRRLWEQDGCRHMGQWLAGHFGVTVSEGLRWTTAAHALERLPLISAAFERGVLSFDKVLQLARFAAPDSEKDLIRWARRASVNAIRRKADLAHRPSVEATRSAHEERFLEWSWYNDGTRLGIEAMLPANRGNPVVTALTRIADGLPGSRSNRPPSSSAAPMLWWRWRLGKRCRRWLERQEARISAMAVPRGAQCRPAGPERR